MPLWDVSEDKQGFLTHVPHIVANPFRPRFRVSIALPRFRRVPLREGFRAGSDPGPDGPAAARRGT